MSVRKNGGRSTFSVHIVLEDGESMDNSTGKCARRSLSKFGTAGVNPCAGRFSIDFSSLQNFNPRRALLSSSIRPKTQPAGSDQGMRTVTKAKSTGNSGDSPPEAPVPWLPLVGYASLSGAVLGPFCDAQHSLNDVLHYAKPDITFPIETCFWVPAQFALAATILCTGHVFLDRLWAPSPSHSPSFFSDRPLHGYDPSWPVVLLGIALFYAQYAFSGRFEAWALSTENGFLLYDFALASSALALWFFFDRTKQGLLWGLLTAVNGPLIEIALINGLGLYQYLHPDPGFLGTPHWIALVYFAGAPANGNLGRKIAATLQAQADGKRRE